jgi:acyl carrier protein
MSVFEQVRKVIAEELSIPEEQVRETSSFEGDLRADSLTIVEVVMELEETFGIEIPEEDLEKIKTVCDLVAHIEAKVSGS